MENVCNAWSNNDYYLLHISSNITSNLEGKLKSKRECFKLHPSNLVNSIGMNLSNTSADVCKKPPCSRKL